MKLERMKNIPNANELLDGVLYYSEDYNTAIHRCACGCGHEVVTPLGNNGWELMLKGEMFSLHPSIGNFSFPCQSHYWIRDSEVVWA